MYVEYRVEKMAGFVIGWAGLFGAFDIAPALCWTLIAFSMIQMPLKVGTPSSLPRDVAEAAAGFKILTIVTFLGLFIAYLIVQ